MADIDMMWDVVKQLGHHVDDIRSDTSKIMSSVASLVEAQKAHTDNVEIHRPQPCVDFKEHKRKHEEEAKESGKTWRDIAVSLLKYCVAGGAGAGAVKTFMEG